MEFLEGGSLAAQRNFPWDARRAAELVGTLARAVHHAHGRGLVHRNIKPGNVLLTADAVPKIADFDLAKWIGPPGEFIDLDHPDCIMGTLCYMAPEQAAGRLEDIGPATDVYGLGALLYELLTGRPPFRGDTGVETLLQMVAESPLPPRRLRPTLPRDLEAVCLQCLHKDPRKRYLSAETLAEDLRRFLAGEPVHARPAGVGERVWKWARRRPALAGLAAAVVLVAAMGSTLATREWRQAVAASASARQNAAALARLSLERGSTLCAQGDTPRGMLWLAHGLATAPDDAAELKDASRTLLARWNEDARARLERLPDAGRILTAARSPDGLLLLTGSEDHTAQFWDADTGRPRGPSLLHDSAVTAVAFSPDGERLVSGTADGDVRVWSSRTRDPLGPAHRQHASVTALAFSPDGTRFASATRTGALTVWDAAAATEKWSVAACKNGIGGVAFSPDGQRLASACGDGTGQVWDVPTGRATLTLTGHAGAVECVAFSPDGTTLLTGSADYTARFWDAVTGKETGRPLCHQGAVIAVTFGDEGRTVLTGSRDRTARFWDAATSESLGPPVRHEDPLRAAFFGRGESLAVLTVSGENSLGRWEVPAPVEGAVERIVLWTQVLAHMELAPDGSIRPLAEDTWEQRRARLEELGGPPLGSQDFHGD
jgi:WD40 repeat protein